MEEEQTSIEEQLYPVMLLLNTADLNSKKEEIALFNDGVHKASELLEDFVDKKDLKILKEKQGRHSFLISGIRRERENIDILRGPAMADQILFNFLIEYLEILRGIVNKLLKNGRK